MLTNGPRSHTVAHDLAALTESVSARVGKARVGLAKEPEPRLLMGRRRVCSLEAIHMHMHLRREAMHMHLKTPIDMREASVTRVRLCES